SLSCFSLLFYCAAAHRSLHSFPTRRSSDLFWLMSAMTGTGGGPLWLWPLATGAASSKSEQPEQREQREQPEQREQREQPEQREQDRKSTRLNSSHDQISYAVFCLKKKKKKK